MSIAYFLITDTQLNETSFLYRDIFKNYDLFDGDGGIKFQKNLSEIEKIAVGDSHGSYFIYSILSDIELSYTEKERNVLGEQYYDFSKQQLFWLKDFISKHLKTSFEVFILRTFLGSRNVGPIMSEYIDIKDFNLPNDYFEFHPSTEYQFVDNSDEHIEWMIKKNKKL